MTARDRALSQISTRVQTRIINPRVIRPAVQRPRVYNGQGTIRPLGASATGLPPRANNSTGALSVGSPVGDSQGIVQSIPNAIQRTELEESSDLIKELIASLRKSQGIQIITDLDPNTTPIFNRHPFDTLYDSERGAEYWFQPANDTSDGEWKPLRQIRVSTNSPTGQGIMNGAIWLQIPASGDASIHLWRQATTEWLEISGGSGGGPGVEITYSDTAPDPQVTPTLPTDPTPLNPGHLWVNRDFGRMWVLKPNLGWQNISGSITLWQEPEATQVSSLVYGDRIQVEEYAWIWDGNDWVKADCCGGPPDPPPYQDGCETPRWDTNNLVWSC